MTVGHMVMFALKLLLCIVVIAGFYTEGWYRYDKYLKKQDRREQRERELREALTNYQPPPKRSKLPSLGRLLRLTK